MADAEGRVRLANCAAERLLSGGDGLTVRDGRLVVGDPAAATELQRVMLGTVTMPLSDRAVERQPPAVVLQRLFGLTKGELARLLLGKRPEEIAEARAVRMPTVRSQMAALRGGDC